MLVFLTGGTGFVGTYVRRELVKNGHKVRCLVRDAESTPPPEDGVVYATGDIRDPSLLTGIMDRCDAVIHLVGIIEEHPADGITFDSIHKDGTRHVVEAAKESNVTRFMHMSANGASPNGVSTYQTSKWAAEEIVREASFERWTIFRPSIIFGEPEDGQPEFVTNLADQLVRPFPVLPIFGDGLYRIQPVAVELVARAFVLALELDAARNDVFPCAGYNVLTYVDVLDTITRALGQSPKPKIHIPLSMVRMGVSLTEWTGMLPLSADQLEMLVQGNTADAERFHQVFSLDPVDFTPANLSYIRAG